MTNLAQSCSSADYCNAMCLIDTGHAIFTTWENLVTYRTHNLVFHSIRDALQFGFFKASKFLKKSFQTAVYHAMEKTHSCMKVTFFVYVEKFTCLVEF